jgi:hypothetical protein
LNVRRSYLVFVLGLALVAMACGGDDGDAPLACVEDLPDVCTPGFTPSWSGVYQNVVVSSCGVNLGTNCHGPEGKQGMLEMSSSSGAYAALLGQDGTRARVLPKDPSCSILMERLTTPDPKLRMPLGGQLSASTICAVQQWIEQGAQP